MIHNSLAIGEERVSAIMATGAIVKVESTVFSSILAKTENPLIIVSYEKFFFSETYKYLTNYKGLFFYTESRQPILLPKTIELIETERIWMPN